MKGHRLAEERSIAFHRAVAEKLREQPALVERARTRVDRLIAQSGRSAPLYDEWKRRLDLPLAELLAFLVERSERAAQLRQATPFAGFLEPRERWRIWREVRAE